CARSPPYYSKDKGYAMDYW
nr:immunoglobulin heavy chain junction region [Mus musculus]